MIPFGKEENSIITSNRRSVSSRNVRVSVCMNEIFIANTEIKGQSADF